MLRSEDGTLLVDEILHTDNDYVLVRDGNRTYKVKDNRMIVEKTKGDSMDSKWKAYEDEGLSPSDVARLLAELQAHREAKRNHETTKRVQPTRTPVAYDDTLTLVIRAAAGGHHGMVTVGDADGAVRKSQTARDPITAAFEASLDDLPDTRSGATN